MIDVNVLDMLYSQYGDGNQMGSNQQETLQKLDALQQWQNPMMQQPQMQPQMQQMPQPAPQMDVGNGVSSVLENLMQSRGSDSSFLIGR